MNCPNIELSDVLNFINILIILYVFKSEMNFNISRDKSELNRKWCDFFEIPDIIKQFSFFIDEIKPDVIASATYNCGQKKVHVVKKMQKNVISKIQKSFYLYKNKILFYLECNNNHSKLDDIKKRIEKIDDKIAELVTVMNTAKEDKEIIMKLTEISTEVGKMCIDIFNN